MMPNEQSPNANPPRKSRRIAWAVVAVLLLLAGFVALRIAARFHRVVQETKQVRSLARELGHRQELIVKMSAQKAFSDGFLQMAFGDRPALLEQVRQRLTQWVGANPPGQEGNVSMILVTYRAEKSGVRDVAVHVFGSLTGPAPGASSSSPQAYELQRSFMAVLGHDVLVLADPEVQKRQQALIDAVLNDRYPVVEQYLEKPVSFVAVIPEPGKLFAQHLRPYLIALLVTGSFGLDEARAEMAALTYDPRRAKDLAQTLSDTRMMAVGVARLKFSSPSLDVGLRAVAQAQILAEGPTVFMRTSMAGDVFEAGLPRVLHILARGIAQP